MTALDIAGAARATPIAELLDNERPIDIARLQAYRLERFRASLRAADCGAALLLEPLGVRYVSGYHNFIVHQMHMPTHPLLVPAEGPLVLFSRSRSDLETVDELREPPWLHYYYSGSAGPQRAKRFIDEVDALVREHAGSNRRLAVDRVDANTWRALRATDFDLHDAHALLERARSIKCAEEVQCLAGAVAVAETGLARVRAALAPGVSENELFAILHHTNIAMGGEWMEARLLSSGDRMNPWGRESSPRRVRPGELLALDTDMVGPHGYCADVSRTFHCGPGRPTPAQRDLYKLALEELEHNLANVAPGTSFREYVERAYRVPERFLANHYPCHAHGVGFCDEYPRIHHWVDWGADTYDGLIEPGMVLCVESYIGEAGGREGVKLEQQVVVTETGHELLSRFPWEDDLLA